MSQKIAHRSITHLASVDLVTKKTWPHKIKSFQGQLWHRNIGKDIFATQDWKIGWWFDVCWVCPRIGFDSIGLFFSFYPSEPALALVQPVAFCFPHINRIFLFFFSSILFVPPILLSFDQFFTYNFNLFDIAWYLLLPALFPPKSIVFLLLSGWAVFFAFHSFLLYLHFP